jgi:hypothetical protein
MTMIAYTFPKHADPQQHGGEKESTGPRLNLPAVRPTASSNSTTNSDARVAENGLTTGNGVTLTK